MLKEALAFVGAIDRLPLPVKSSPGFLVNRALTPYMLEAMVMLDEKVDKLAIDAAAEKFGMPMGPIELADQVGLDICLDVGDMLRSKFGDQLPPTPAWLRDKVARGELGRKTGKGFYVWKDGKAEKTPASPSTAQPTEEMIDRLILPMSNVCVAALREGIVDDADSVDGAMIFGTGYAPFRGGPLNYARTRGPENVVPRCARWCRSSAAASRRMPAGGDFNVRPTRQLFTPLSIPRSSPVAISAPARWRCLPTPIRTATFLAAGCSARWISVAGYLLPRSQSRARSRSRSKR